jgi:iron-sulfur-dependent L-serine dehydratase single chain form
MMMERILIAKFSIPLGGFIVCEGEKVTGAGNSAVAVPYPFKSAAELLHLTQKNLVPIWKIVLENEKASRTEDEIRQGVFRIWDVMKNCTHRGLQTEGILPGGLKVRRRAAQLYRELSSREMSDPLSVMDWINVFAIAVNEENAAGGRVVTAPTNGAAGIIPAVAHYYRKFVNGADDEGIFRYFLTAAAIGALYKENASISGAEVGCLGEVGVACLMAAAKVRTGIVVDGHSGGPTWPDAFIAIAMSFVSRSPSTAIRTNLAPQAFDTFFDNYGSHYQGSCRISPPQSEESVQQQPAQQNGG